MEKYGAMDSDLINGLRDEEAQLMVRMSSFLTNTNEKTAEEQVEMRKVETRLHQVRAKITEFDLGKNRQQ